jgi:hypothetical protein
MELRQPAREERLTMTWLRSLFAARSPVQTAYTPLQIKLLALSLHPMRPAR